MKKRFQYPVPLTPFQRTTFKPGQRLLPSRWDWFSDAWMWQRRRQLRVTELLNVSVTSAVFLFCHTCWLCLFLQTTEMFKCYIYLTTGWNTSWFCWFSSGFTLTNAGTQPWTVVTGLFMVLTSTSWSDSQVINTSCNVMQHAGFETKPNWFRCSRTLNPSFEYW